MSDIDLEREPIRVLSYGRHELQIYPPRIAGHVRAVLWGVAGAWALLLVTGALS